MDWWVAMPKVELHAHLNGSIRFSTLLELARELGDKGTIVFSDVEHVILKNDRSLPEVFKLFDLIHILTTDHATVTRITKEVVEDFAAENVVYLELRTTPKPFLFFSLYAYILAVELDDPEETPKKELAKLLRLKNDEKGMSKQSYMEAVLEGLRSVNTVDIDFAHKLDAVTPGNYLAANGLGPERKKIYVRLLLSIDRRETTEAAMETVMLALQLKHLGVVGIDLSGNPVIGKWQTFLPALKFAKDQGLSITLHSGEVPNPEEIDTMLDFLPGRIGHACCFEEGHWRKLKSFKTPVEICLTSNIRTETISSVDVHHFADLYNSEHPVILCTDDSGVFSTSLSGEYILASTTFGLGRREMFRLARDAINFIFADNQVKEDLEEIFASASGELAL